jgi:DNA-directed RNA polymerase subunit E'/Rpb7
MTIIEKRICVDHEYLNRDINSYIFQKIKDVTLNECTKEFGYILSIKKLVKIKDNYISNVNCDNIFTVVFDAETLKPENGKKFTGVVCMIFAGGIFLNILDKQKVLIPVSSLIDYVFKPSEKCFKKKDKTIKEGDVIDVIITGTKYSKQSFSCFGSIVE